MSDLTASGDERDSLDRIAADLLALKESRGHVSFGELCRRIGDLRVERGVAPAAAYPPRTTVYDAFRAGRSRMNPALLRDIVVALEAGEEEADRWVQRYERLRDPGDRIPVASSEPEVAGTALPPLAPTESVRPRATTVAMLLVVGVILDLVGIAVVQVLHLPIYLDMVGTAIASIVLGPWHGAAVGLGANLLGFAIGSPGAAPFALVNVAGALIWGFGIRRFRMGDDIVRFFTLNLLVAVGCSLVGTPLNIILFGGYSGHGSDTVISSIASIGLPVFAATFSANILTSVIDKLLTGFLALMAVVWLHRSGGLLVPHLPLVENLAAAGLTPPAAPRKPEERGRSRSARSIAPPTRDDPSSPLFRA